MKPGAIIASRFVLERRLGSGGMGVVWSAIAAGDRAKVALKFLRGDKPHSERVRQRFLQEAHATRKINHPGVVLIRDVVEDDEGLPVLVMDLLEGETLAARLERAGPMKPIDAIHLLLPAVSAIAAAHDQRVIHRDLKPENLFLCEQKGGEAKIRVLDFGIAKVMRDGDSTRSGLMTSTGVVMGTPFYMAPEQLFSEGEIDERADVWAFGVILYECIAGRRPFVGPSVGQVLRLIALDEYTPLAQAAPETPPEIGDVVARLLARERSRRPRTMREVERLLGTILDGTYEMALPYAETIEISPAAQTFADKLQTPSSGQLRALERSVSGTTGSGGASRGDTARVPMTSRRGLVIAGLGAAAVAAFVTLRARGPEAAPHGTGDAQEIASHAPAPLPPLIASQAQKVAEAPSPPMALPAHSATARHVARLDAHDAAPPATAMPSSTAPAASAAPTAEARRPGSVVDVPPF